MRQPSKKPYAVDWPQFDISSFITGVNSVNRTVASPYKIGNVWRMRFNLDVAFALGTRTGVTFGITGVTWKSTNYQVCTGTAGGGIAPYYTYTLTGGNIEVNHASAATTTYRIFGDVELDSKPTWAVDYTTI